LATLYTIAGTNKKVTLKELADWYADKYNIPTSLFRALITVESNWNYKATSPAGAIGLGQGMPDTIRGAGYDVTSYKASVYIQLDFASKYFKSMYNSTKSWELALAAYNAGLGAVRKYNGIPPYRETINYVTRVMELANMKVEEIENKLLPSNQLRTGFYCLQNLNTKLKLIIKEVI